MSVVYRTLAKAVVPLFQPKVTDIRGLEHLPKKGGYVIAANHVDWLDGFYIAAALYHYSRIKVHFLTKSNNYWWTTATVQIPSTARGTVIDAAVAALRRGQVVCNFIEGQRNTSGLLLPGKTGTVRMAIAAAVPVVPLGLSCAPGKTMAESVKYLVARGHPVRIRIGRPIHFPKAETSNLSYAELREATRRVMNAIAPLAAKRN